jgi:hypothetical protein
MLFCNLHIAIMLRIYYMDYEAIKLRLNLRNVPLIIIPACRIALNLH